MKYIYHVVYSFTKRDGAWGTGSSEMTVRAEITSSEQVQSIRKSLFDTHPEVTELVVTNWILLRKER